MVIFEVQLRNMEKAEKLSAFRKQMETIAAHGIISLSVALGHKLKLFDALAKVSSEKAPAVAKDVADAAGMKERLLNSSVIFFQSK